MNEKIKEIQTRYIEKLSGTNCNSLQGALKIIENCKQKVAIGEENVELDFEVEKIDNDSVKEIFEMLKDFQNEIKEMFITENHSLTHTTEKAPEEIQNGRFEPSKSRVNTYGIERGNYFFASSEQIESSPYIARNHNIGMVVIGNICIYNSDVFKNVADTNRDKRLILKKPNYIYELNAEQFTPVVALKTDKNGVPFFEFSEEWISKKSIDINDNSIVRKIRKVEDVTTILEKYQVFTDIKRTGEATEILGAKTPEESKKKFFDSLKNKRLKYINGCYAINVDPKYEIENKIEFNEK